MDSIKNNKQAVRKFFSALSKGDTEAIVNAYADDGRVETMGETLISGSSSKAEIAHAIDGILEVFPKGLNFTITGMIAEGEKVAVEAHSKGKHISGQTYCNDYHFLFEFRDGKLLLLREYMDTELVTDVLCGGQRPPFGVGSQD